jgi:pyrroloquinoline quinone biosynthesis protein A
LRHALIKAPAIPASRHQQQEERPMWKKPAFTDLRIGFEVTMYFASR